MTRNSQKVALLSGEAEPSRSTHDESQGANLLSSKPRLLVEPASPDRTVRRLREILSGAPDLFDRGVPVRLARDLTLGGAVAQVMTPDDVVLAVHQVCRPYELKTKKDGSVQEIDTRLPRFIATMYLGWRGEWGLPLLNGIASAPLLRSDGAILSGTGYDPESGLWREAVPDLTDRIPDRSTLNDAASALQTIRATFKTFPFADAETIYNAEEGMPVVDISKPPGHDESAFLVALLTGVCRPSLLLAPGILIRAAAISGAGTGKGLLARCISLIAFGREPHAVTSGATAEELEKRIAAELIQGNPSIFLDNINNTAFRSDLLASAITERPARVRLLGRSQMVPLNSSALVMLTGNGLTVSEDLARRFIPIELDAKVEDPETRAFTKDIKAIVKTRRVELLAAALAIWRWGSQTKDIAAGRPLGSFEMWSRSVRDPLVALGCKDPVERVEEVKHRDGRRQAIADLFAAWAKRHGYRPVKVSELHDDVRNIADPQGRGRQYLAARLDKLTGTRLGGFVLTQQDPAGQWGATTYALERVAAQAAEDRGHRGHRNTNAAASAEGTSKSAPRGPLSSPMPPMPPMPKSS